MTSDAAERLRGVKVRVTSQRMLVLDALEALGGHRTADEVMRWAVAHAPGINLATIYRTLEILVSSGLVAQTDLGGGASSYELVGASPHHHLVCTHCGAVIEVDDAAFAALRAQLLEDWGFRAQSRHIALFGICASCQAASDLLELPG